MSLAQSIPINASVPLETVITVGTEPLSQAPQSGSILRALLAEPGFKTRITDGVKNGHAYNIVHVPGSPNFILRDTWTNATGKRETRYQSFVITKDAQPQIFTHNTDNPDAMSALMGDLQTSLDKLLALAKS